jgi:hypothetical protein
MLPAFPAGTAHDASRLGPGMLAIFEDLGAVDENVDHTRRVLVRIVERGVILDRTRVKEHDIGRKALG